MKKTIIIFTSLLLVISGCKKANELSKFDINYSTEVTIPVAAALGAPINLVSPSVSTDFQSKFQINSTEAERVESVVLKTMKLTLTSPTDSDLGVIESIELYMNADGLTEEKIAWKNSVSSTAGTKLTLDVSGINIKPFITSESFQIRARTIIDEVITTDHEIDVDATFEVEANIFGS